MKKRYRRLLSSLLACSFLACPLAACSPNTSHSPENQGYVGRAGLDEAELGDEVVAMAGAPALAKQLMPVASGKKTEETEKAVIDYSNTKDGYVMVQYTASTSQRLKAKVIGPKTEYIYNIQPGQWTTFALADGSGSYTVKVYENTSGNRYATVANITFSAVLTDEFAPFVRPNQYVDYEDAKATIAMAEKLAGTEKDPMKKVEKIYDYVVETLSYDKERAETVESGYLPNLDDVLEHKKGICFDYAALMAGMLRSQGVPCKLVVGYAGETYHAWISVWSEKSGWVDGAIFFDGTAWQRMDPTFASTADNSQAILEYIGNGKNYSEKFIY